MPKENYILLGKKLSIGFRVILTIFGLTLFVSKAATSQETVLYSFSDNDTEPGYEPYGGLIFDAAGNLYGTTQFGGVSDGGIVFKLTPTVPGSWTETLLHRFSDNGTDGYYPFASLIFDASGNLYGTTYAGGANDFGTVFELAHTADGSWTETVLYSFNRADGHYPAGSMIFDTAGNLYGTTGEGGYYDDGTVFELTPVTGGRWTEKVLYNFNSSGTGGYDPGYCSLILDASGNLFGTNFEGGNSTCGGGGCGTVFELIRTAGGRWKEKVLVEFNGKDGANPYRGLVFDAKGNLYGTASAGGRRNGGTAFELKPTTGGAWTEKVLHQFGGPMPEGYGPLGNLIFDDSGNLYGTTYLGGTDGYGTVFKLAPMSDASWTEKVLVTFSGEDGKEPFAGLIFDASGDLFGTTNGGGAGGGTVFEVTLPHGNR